MDVTVNELLTLAVHLTRWLGNLGRAKVERRRESKTALRDVVRAVRETSIYLREPPKKKAKRVEQERRLSMLWTDLSFRLQDLGLDKLARRCQLKGRYWADPESVDEDVLKGVSIRLDDVERMAQVALRKLKP